MSGNQLYYGDNLEILRDHIPPESVDLVYLDPPFNSNRSYNVLFKNKSGAEAQAQIEAFDDTWSWSQESEQLYAEMMSGAAPVAVADALEAMRKLLGDNDVLAYLVMMTARLVELRRVLKPTGSLYLHCDPTASHYLKVILDAIFGAAQFKAEIIWRRYGSHNDAKGYGHVHDVILFYTVSSKATFNKQYQPYDDEYVKERFKFVDQDGRRYSEQNLASPNPRPNLTYEFTAANGITYDPPPNGWKFSPDRLQELDDAGRLHYPKKPTGRLRMKNYLDELPGVPIQDVWDDIVAIGGTNAERLGYPTQKPVSLMERIVSASSNEGDVVLDPFCGCGTTIDAAQRLNRRWVGIDITYLSIDLIRKRLREAFGDKISDHYSVHGIPQDVSGAQAMFDQNPFEFERWAVSLIDGQPNEKQVGDKGVDGIVRFPIDKKMTAGRVIVSVKGGQQLAPAMVRDLIGTVDTQRAEMGVLITMKEPTRGMVDAAKKSGTYKHPISGKTYPKAQIITVPDLFKGKQIQMPTPMLPYVKAPTFAGWQLSLDEL